MFKRRAGNTTALGTGRNWRGGKWAGEEAVTWVLLEATRSVLLSKQQFLGPPP